jgi:erythromycin esterase
VLSESDRWPTWMWANEEVADFVSWLRTYNVEADTAVGFYGLDVYSLWESLHAVFDYLQEHHSDAVEVRRKAIQCFEPFGEDHQRYAWSTRLSPAACEDDVVALLLGVHSRAGTLEKDPEVALDAVQNAEVVAGAEPYYRTMVRAERDSWNVRDVHMADTLDPAGACARPGFEGQRLGPQHSYR